MTLPALGDVNMMIPNSTAFKMCMWNLVSAPDDLVTDDHRRLFKHLAEKIEFQLIHLLAVMDYITDFPATNPDPATKDAVLVQLEIMIASMCSQYHIPFFDLVREFANQRGNAREGILNVLETPDALPTQSEAAEISNRLMAQTKTEILDTLRTFGKKHGVDVDSIINKVSTQVGLDENLENWGMPEVDKKKLQ